MDLVFQAPNRPLSINESNRMHWAARKRRLKGWAEQTGWAWLQNRAHWDEVRGKPCSVQVYLPFPDKRRRDAHNYSGTVCKSIIDELVRQRCWHDDTPEWVYLCDSVIVLGTECTVRLTPRAL